MKKISFLFVLLISYTCFAQVQGLYSIEGTTQIKNGIAILNDYVNPDTVKVVDGKFSFQGNIKTPKLISIHVPPSNPSRIIIEPGTITVIHDTVNGYRMGGAPLNFRFQKIEDELKPFTKKHSALVTKYNSAPEEEKLIQWLACEKVREEKLAKAKELILADGTYAGFVEMLPVFMGETPSNIKIYLDAFKAYSYDRMYKYVADHYVGAAKTDVGMTAPGWTRKDPNGKSLKLSSLRGKYVLIDFWYSGCYWCRKMTPHLKKIYADLKSRGFEIVSLSVDPLKDEDKWRKAMKEDDAPWLQAWDFKKTLPDQYSVKGYPTMFFLDKNGKVLRKIVGYHDEPILRYFFTSEVK